MHVLVTGANGFCGSHVIRALCHAGHNVTGHCHRLPGDNYNKEFDLKLIVGDLADGLCFPDGLDAVIHTAARSALDEPDETKVDRDNRIATEKLVEASILLGVKRFYYFSTISVFGDVSESEITEETPACPKGVYGLSKLAGERCLIGTRNQLPSLSLRLPAIAGRLARRHWLAELTRKFLGGDDVAIFNPDALFNNVVHVEDLASFLVHLLERDILGNDVVILGAGNPMSIRDVAYTLKSQLKSKSRIRTVDAGTRKSFTLNSTRAAECYGYGPSDTMDILLRYSDEMRFAQANASR